MTEYQVTTLDRTTGEAFTYSVPASSEAAAISRIIVGIAAGTKRGDTVYECAPAYQ